MAPDTDPPENDATSAPRTDPLLRTVWREYAEMPGLRLTIQQAQRLWAMDELRCAELLDSLVSARLLVRTDDGRYARALPSAQQKGSKAHSPKRAIAG